MPLQLPGKIVPPYTNTDGTLIRAEAISMPGKDLSQPAKVTSASSRSACMTVSTESAMISRLTSDACMPSWPIEMPSLTAMVVNSIGKPPASRTPTLARLASRPSGMLHGVTSFHDEHTATCGLVPVVVGHADRSEHGAGRGSLVAVGHLVETRLHRVGHVRKAEVAGGCLPGRIPGTPS